MINHPGYRLAEVAVAIGLLLLATVLTRCAPPRPVVITNPPPPPVVIQKTIIQGVPDVAPRGTVAGQVVKAYRAEEQKVRDAVGYPGATSDQIRDIYAKERAAHAATQNLITKDGHSLPSDEKAAHDAIDDLHRAREAPSMAKPTEDTK